jgi:hypothetical protein
MLGTVRGMSNGYEILHGVLSLAVIRLEEMNYFLVMCTQISGELWHRRNFIEEEPSYCYVANSSQPKSRRTRLRPPAFNLIYQAQFTCTDDICS